MSKPSKGHKNANGEGSIYQRSNGTWAGTAHVLTTDGTRKRKTVYGKTWEEAHEKLVELKAKSHRGIPAPDRSWKVAEYLRYWLRVYVSELRPKTAEGYEGAVRLHLIPGLGNRRLTGLQVQHVRAFLDGFKQKCLCCANEWDKQRRCCSAGTCCERLPSVRQVQYVHAVLRNALQHAMREELLARNVATLVKVTTPRYKVGKGLPVDQVKSLLKAAQGHRLYALYVVAATMGLRRGELLGLRWEDVDLDNGTITIEKTVQRAGGKLHIQDAKTESSESVLPLPEITRTTLQRHRDDQDKERVNLAEAWREHGLVFPSEIGTPMEPRNLARHFAGLRERVGITDVRLHDFRHTVVTVLMELGVPPHIVQAIARHSDVKLTLKIYAHSNLQEMRKALDKLDGWLS
ncbi:tyrosine-type recombinase/integrase [Dactylosporangium sp. AC04546]|uniref:tyrosine-type recombinase/integrase n=1 Tax=Dactylosporangium sp. AC04546 TaxID=2862460 RepID=UPI001EDE2EB0|nr:tyrosine-type recombinase/integrase [Dactylosporangium sp. AC04546]WVK82287.1 tyrosine-type recombinase/integrase [Dactylosporangium sp. AC04546]